MRGNGTWARAVATTALVALLVLGTAATRASGAAVRQTVAEQSFADAINAVRAAHGLPALATESALVVSARAHSRKLVGTNTFVHGSGWVNRLLGAGASGPYIGENLGWCAPRVCPGADPATLVREWLASPAHRKNVLDPYFRHVGVGLAAGPFHGWQLAYVITTDFDS